LIPLGLNIQDDELNLQAWWTFVAISSHKAKMSGGYLDAWLPRAWNIWNEKIKTGEFNFDSKLLQPRCLG